MPNRRPAAAPRCAGLTLVEVIVAITLLGIAVLGVASTSTFVVRLAGSARARTLASRAVALVVDSLRTVACPSLVPGAAATASGVVTWSVSAAGGVRQLHAVLTPASGRLAVPVVEETLVPCD